MPMISNTEQNNCFITDAYKCAKQTDYFWSPFQQHLLKMNMKLFIATQTSHFQPVGISWDQINAYETCISPHLP